MTSSRNTILDSTGRALTVRAEEQAIGAGLTGEEKLLQHTA